jgi:PhzF family phenazine biosynthesis protein
MNITQYQVDAFASRPFEGNPAAVCVLDAWLSETLMQSIAAENNLSETAFLVMQADGYALRWFTPVSEVDLCGHATLAAAHVLFAEYAYAQPSIRFHTRSGVLTVEKSGDLLCMDFPMCAPNPVNTVPSALLQGLGVTPKAVLAGDDYLVVLEDEAMLTQLVPDFTVLSTLDLRGVIVTAKGEQYDFVSRFFAPKLGVNEDPVTGSAHCQLAPYWAKELNKPTLVAKQVSKRGGVISCQMQGNRVLLSGSAVTVLQSAWRFVLA